MNIGSVAEKTGVPTKTIRFYESIRLIAAADRRSNGYRIYSVVDVHTLQFIRGARSLGFSVEEVRTLLDLWEDKTRASADVKKMAAVQLKALEKKIDELVKIRRTLTDLVEHCRGDDRPDCPILDGLELDVHRSKAN